MKMQENKGLKQNGVKGHAFISFPEIYSYNLVCDPLLISLF